MEEVWRPTASDFWIIETQKMGRNWLNEPWNECLRLLSKGDNQFWHQLKIYGSNKKKPSQVWRIKTFREPNLINQIFLIRIYLWSLVDKACLG